jgi:hypothetical protein
MGMLAITRTSSSGDELDGKAEEGFTVEAGVEETEAEFDDTGEKRDRRSFRKVPVITDRIGPWALNQEWKELSGHAEGSGALNDLNFKKGYKPGNFGALICGIELKPRDFSLLCSFR